VRGEEERGRETIIGQTKNSNWGERGKILRRGREERDTIIEQTKNSK
jgi:hypothetical protein